MGTITSFTATAELKSVVTMAALEERLTEGSWFKTWRTVHQNGVVEFDFVDFSSGENATVYMVPSDPEDHVSVVRMFSREEGVLESMSEVIGDTVEPLEVHRADIGIFSRQSEAPR